MLGWVSRCAYDDVYMLTDNRGGIRGIIELAVLQAIQDRIGVALRHFFDLVVGTR